MLTESRMASMLEEGDLDVLVAATPENVFHSSGMHCIATTRFGEAGYSVWSRSMGGPYLVMPARETSSLVDMDVDPEGVFPYGKTNIYLSDSLSTTDQRIHRLQNERDFDDPIPALAAAISELADGPRVGVERSGFEPKEYEALERRVSDRQLIPADEQFYSLREVKTDAEIERLRTSATITERSMEEAMECLEPGMTERDLANEFRARVCEKGGRPLFLTVGFGTRTAYTHPIPGDREIEDGDLVRWDAGCTYENYCSDVGRTFAYGSASDEHERKYEALYAGLESALSELQDGTRTDAVFEAGVDAVQSSGVDAFDEFSPFHLGHGIGVEIYDTPTIVPDGGTIRENMVMCIEPPYNELGSGGFLIEDEVVVTDDGFEKLTDAAASLPIMN